VFLNVLILAVVVQQTYLQDKCSSVSDTKDSNICRSSNYHSSCTGDVECDGEIISTGDCDNTCSYIGGSGGDITIYLNSSSGDRYYEHGSVMNITAISDQGAYMCLDIPVIGYGDDYVCGNTAITALVDVFGSKQEFNVSTPATLTSNTTLYLEHRKFDVIDDVYLGLDGTGVSDISIDVGNDGSIEHSFPLAELTGSTFYLDKTSTGLTSKNLTFDTAGTKIFNIRIPTGVTINSGIFNLTGYDYTVSRTDNFYTGTGFKLWNITGNIWSYDIEITSDLSSSTEIIFPHYLGNNVHPVKIFNITLTESENSPVVITGEKWDGSSNLVLDSDTTKIKWILESDVKSGDFYRIFIGKNVTWINSSSENQIDVNLDSVPPKVSVGVYYEGVEQVYETVDDVTVSSLYCTGCTSCGGGSFSNFYDNDWTTYASVSGAEPYCQGNVDIELTNSIENYLSVYQISLNFSGKRFGTDISYPRSVVYLYNYYTDIYDNVYTLIDTWRDDTLHYMTIDTPDENYYYNNGNIKRKFTLGTVFAQAVIYYESELTVKRTPHSPSLEIGTSSVWDYSGALLTETEISDITPYLEIGTNSLNFSNTGSYGSLLIYFKPFWSSTPSNITVLVGNGNNYQYENTTVFNTTGEVELDLLDTTDYLSSCTEIYCDVPYFISSKSAGIIEVNSINFTYTTENNKIELNKTSLNSFLDREGAVTEVFIPIRITGVFGSLDVIVNDTYYGFDPTIITVSELGNSSNNDTITATVVYSNYTIDYPSGIEYWEIFPYSKIQNGVVPFGGNPMFLTNMLGDSSAPDIDIYVRLNESLICANIFGTSTTGEDIILSTLDQIICNDVTYSGTCNISNLVNLACSNYNDAYIEPVFIFTGKCNGC